MSDTLAGLLEFCGLVGILTADLLIWNGWRITLWEDFDE
jgi:hypothetical protein